MPRAKLALIAVAGALALPSAASAATFTVNEATPDQGDANTADGACDSDDVTSGHQCTLRAAIQQANAGASNDTIKFSSLFDGNTLTSLISLTSDLTPITQEVTINGGDCGTSGAHKPCVELDPDGDSGIDVQTNGVDIRGLAIISGNPGITLGADNATVKGSWLGIRLTEAGQANFTGILIEDGQSNVIGGTTGADRNVFGFNDLGLDVAGADHTRIRGNYFGVKADGTTPAPGSDEQIKVQSDPSTDTVIGATVSASAAATTKCDGGCNVIASSPSDGILNGGQGTTIKGNFIGLDKTGQAARENDIGIENFNSDTTIGGDTSAERNFITGGTFGVFEGSTDSGATFKRNFVGLDSTGTTSLDPPLNFTASFRSSETDPDTISRNRLVGSSNGLDIEGESARVVRNKIGIGKGGGNLPGGSVSAIRVPAANSTIGEPGAGNTIGNSGNGILIFSAATFSGDGNKVQGNFIGTDSDGASHPNAGVGIHLINIADPADDNVIGGTSSASENVISNSGDDAIRLEDPAGTSSGNRFKRNRGKDNGNAANELFIDLEGTNGFGNGGTGPNGGIEAPPVNGYFTSRTHAEGTCVVGATIYIFRTSSAPGASPNRINAFVDTAVDANMDGDWSAGFSQIPPGQQLTALQIDPSGNASELDLAKATS